MSERHVYFSQVNNTFGRNAFLPYSVGLIQAFCQQQPDIAGAYKFKGFCYLRKDVHEVAAAMDRPDVFGVSCYIWNFEYSIALAAAVKQAHPGCLIVLGGPHVPLRSENFFRKYPFVDLLVHYEGELTFADVLRERLKDAPDYTQVQGLSVQLPDGGCAKTPNRERVSDLSVLPSPYLTGVFDELIQDDYDFHASQETNRGCPYSCSFCDWGSNVMAKLKKFPTERLTAEFEWFAAHKIDLLYNCDANYGIFDRDFELTEAMASLKARTGFPNKFRAAYAKNSDDKVYRIAQVLHRAGMNKGVTLSFQSMHDKTLQLIKRKNIKIENFSQIINRYRSEGIATYSEIIIGLPGETYATFADGLDLLIRSGQHDSIQCYSCEVLPNSEMGHPDYQALHGIKSAHTPVLVFHGTPAADPHTEHYEIVVETAMLPPDDWLRCQMFAWAVQAFHCLNRTQVLAVWMHQMHGVSYRQFYETLLEHGMQYPETHLGRVVAEARGCFERLRRGEPWGIVDQQFGNITWPVEEGGFLHSLVFESLDNFLFDVQDSWSQKLPALESGVLYYQHLSTKRNAAPTICTFANNLHERVLGCYLGETIPVDRRPHRYLVDSKHYADRETFAREAVWYARKGGQFRNTFAHVPLR